MEEREEVEGRWGKLGMRERGEGEECCCSTQYGVQCIPYTLHAITAEDYPSLPAYYNLATLPL